MALNEFTQVLSVSDIAPGEMKGVQIGKEKLLIARVDDEYFAVDNICTHFYALLSDGEFFPEECQVQCPLHDSRFNLRTGEPSDLPAEDPVAVYQVDIRGDEIWVGPREAA